MAIYLAECRHLGVSVLAPDVNASGANFTAVGLDIRFGLSAVRNVGDNAVKAITAGRTDGAYASIADFLRRVPASACNKAAVESLIKAGAFDSLGYARCGLHEACERAIAAARPKGKRAGQGDLFAEGAFDVDIPTAEWDARIELAHERDMLGLYVSAHPLDGVAHELAAQTTAPITAILDGSLDDGAQVTVGGMLTGVKRATARTGKRWAKAQLEDLAGGVEVLFFPKVYEVIGPNIAEDTIVLIKARVSRKEDRIALFVEDMVIPRLPAAATGEGLELVMAAPDATTATLARVKTALMANSGERPVWLRLNGPGGSHRLRLSGDLQVAESVTAALDHLPLSRAAT
jgi:DNA polymerase-3 subunit alpha